VNFVSVGYPRWAFTAFLIAALQASSTDAAYVLFFHAYGDWSVICSKDEGSGRRWCNMSAPPPSLATSGPRTVVMVSEPAPGVSVDVIAGQIGAATPPSPPPDSWGSDPYGALAIWLIRVDAGGEWELPAAPPGVNRMLHCFLGDGATVGGHAVSKDVGARLRPEAPTSIIGGRNPSEFLLLQGRPIGAPVFQMGPFVMNSPEELQQAFTDYRTTGFGGWPWNRPDPTHERNDGRFAIHADGRVEHRDMLRTT